MVAHRVAYLMTFGSIEPDKILLHSCDNPMCCNPAHLKQGTDADNMNDAVSKGRSTTFKGSENHNAKFTESDIVEIRRLLSEGKTINEVAAIYGVSFQSIYQIGRGWTWKHVPSEIPPQIKKRLHRIPEETIAEIKRLWTVQGMKQRDIADRFNLWRPTVSKMLKGLIRAGKPANYYHPEKQSAIA